MWKKFLTWLRPTEEALPVRRDPVAEANDQVAEANARLIAVTARIPVVLGEES